MRSRAGNSRSDRIFRDGDATPSSRSIDRPLTLCDSPNSLPSKIPSSKAIELERITQFGKVMISHTERTRRDAVISLIRAFAAKKLTNDEFEERYDAVLDSRPVRQWEDKALWAVKTAVWFLYDDLSTHRLEGKHALSKEQKGSLARCILFLQTDLRYEWKTHSFISLRVLFLNLITLGQWNRFGVELGEAIDWEIWPFRRSADFAEAKKDPKRHRSVE